MSLVAAGMVFGSTAAVAGPAARHSRMHSDVTNSKDLAGVGAFGVLMGLLAASGVIIAIVASGHNHDKNPVSP